jgi:aminoglycoside phosphotransferase (APT) family kinase protein
MTEAETPKPVRRLTFDLTPDQVQPLVAAVDPSLAPTGLARLHGGSTEVYRIDIAGSEPIVLKLYGEALAWLPAKEALVAGWFGDRLDFPTPRWLRLDESRTLLPLRYALTTWLPGSAVADLVGRAALADLYRQMGALLRRVHQVPMEAYGYVVADGLHEPRATNADYMNFAFDEAFRRFRDRGGDPGLVRRLEAATVEREILAVSPGPVLCHDDFHQANLLCEPDARGGHRLCGLLDFGNARSADALFDLAKTLFVCAHQDPQSESPLREGYGPLDHPDPGRALWLYRLFHRVTMWAYLTGLGGDTGTLLPDLAAMVG